MSLLPRTRGFRSGAELGRGEPAGGRLCHGLLVERTASRDNNFDVIRLAAAATLDFQSGPLGDWFSAPLPIELTAIFTGGVLLYALRHRIRLDWRLGALAVVAILLTPHMPVDLRPLVWPLALPYVSTLVAYAHRPACAA